MKYDLENTQKVISTRCGYAPCQRVIHLQVAEDVQYLWPPYGLYCSMRCLRSDEIAMVGMIVQRVVAKLDVQSALVAD